MIHALFFSAMACLGIGLMALARAIFSYRRSRLRFEKVSVIMFALLFYYFLPGVVLGYFEDNAGAVLSVSLGRALRLAFYLQRPLLLALIAFFLIRLFLLVQRESWRRSWLSVFWGTQLLVSSFRMLAAASVIPLPAERQRLFYVSTLIASLFVFYGSVGAVAWRAQRRRFPHLNPVQARYLKWFGRAVLFIFILSFAVDLVGIFASMGGAVHGFLSVLPVFLFMTASLLFLDRFVAVMYPHLEPGRPWEERFESLVSEYGISPREKEIVLLVCQGKTNKEIEDALFISLPTVKDHVSNIFRKTGATNRVQLAALFHFTLDR